MNFGDPPVPAESSSPPENLARLHGAARRNDPDGLLMPKLGSEWLRLLRTQRRVDPGNLEPALQAELREDTADVVRHCPR